MNVTKEIIILYLADRLGSEERAEVEAAIRDNVDLRSFYAERLDDLWFAQNDDAFEDLDADNDDEDGSFESPVIVQLPGNRDGVYFARSEGLAVAANHLGAAAFGSALAGGVVAAAIDFAGIAKSQQSGPQDQSEPYKFSWTEIPGEDVILLTFIDKSGHIENGQELLLDVSLTYELKDSGEEIELRVGVVKLVQKSNHTDEIRDLSQETGSGVSVVKSAQNSSHTWIGQFGLADFGVEMRNCIITTLKGVRV